MEHLGVCLWATLITGLSNFPSLRLLDFLTEAILRLLDRATLTQEKEGVLFAVHQTLKWSRIPRQYLGRAQGRTPGLCFE